MGVLRQFGALLWKNYVLRKRKPVFLLLEVLWPVIIFVAIALVRRGVPPNPRDSCYYQERALPSAGMLPFLQTSACTLSNPCLTPEKVEEKASAQERLRTMLYKVEPYIRKNTTLTAFEALPTIAKVVSTLKTKLNDTVLEEFDDKLVLKNLIRDEEKIVDMLVDKYKLMSEQQARDLLDSSLNPVQLMKTLSDIDFREVACDKAKLMKYVYFPKHTDVAAVSKGLCDIDDDLISDITNEVVRQLDIANLIRFGEEFAKFMGEFDIAVLLGDLADLAEVYIEKSYLLAAMEDLPDLSIIPKILDNLADIIPAFESLQGLDMKSISSLYELFDPLLETYVTDQATLDVIRTMGKSLEDFNTPLNSTAEQFNWKKVVNLTASLSDLLDSMGNESMSLDALSFTNFNSIYEALTVLFSENSTNMGESLPQALAKLNSANMAGLEEMLRGYFPSSSMNMMMAIAYEVTDMIMSTMDTYYTINSELRYFVTLDRDVMGTNVLNIFIMMGPEKTSAFLTEILKPTNFEPLILGKVDAKAMCEDTLDLIYEPDDQTVKSYLCADIIVDRFMQLPLSSLYQDDVKKMEETMTYISSVIDDPESVENTFTMETLYAKINEMSNETTYLSMESTREWTNILTYLPYEQSGILVTSGETDPEAWESAWYNVSTAAFMTNMMLSMKQAGESMEGTDLYQYTMPSAVSMEAYWAAAAEPYRMMQDMMDKTTPLGMMVENMEYMPEVLPAMLNLMNNQEMKAEMDAFYADPMYAICEDDFLSLLDVSDEIPMDNMKSSICDTDWEEFGRNMVETMDWMGTMQKKVDVLYYNGTTTTVDWDTMMANMELYMTALSRPEKIFEDAMYVVNKMNVTKLLESLGNMDNNGLQDFTFNEVNNSVASLVSVVESVDKSLANMSFWNYAKHIAKFWIAYTNIASDVYTHTKGSIDITEYMQTISPTLGEYYMNISTMFPTLFEDLSKSLQNPQTILSGMLNVKWENICNGTKISEIFRLKDTEGVQELERGLCKLNWTAIMEEVVDYNPNIKVYSDELMILAGSIEAAPAITVNWTELAEGTIDLIENMQSWFTANSLPQVEGIDTDSLNTTLGNFIKTLTQTDQWDAARFGAIGEEMMNLLTGQSGSDGNSTVWDLAMQSTMLQLYISYHSLKFFNQQLHYINTTDPLDIKKYLDSEEANKVFRAMEVSSQVNAALLGNAKEYTTNPQKMTELFSSNWTAVCEDEETFSKLFSVPVDSNLTVRDLQDTVCGINLDFEKLQTELEKSIPGLKAFINALSNLERMAAEGLKREEYVNITQYTAENERFSKLLESIIMHPPHIIQFWATPEEDTELYLKQLEDFANFTMAGFGDQQVTSTFGTVQQHLGEALSGVASSSPEIESILYIADAYLKTVENSIIRDQTGLWEDPRASLAKYPEMLKVWDLMEQVPEIYETFQYTLSYSNKKITTFVGAVMGGFDTLCSADPDTLMTVPPTSNFSFTQFMVDLCDINTTTLTQESTDYYGGQLIMDAYATIDNITEPTNITAMFLRLDELYGTLVDMSNDTAMTDMKLPRFLDMKIWEEVFSKSEAVLANSTLNSVDQASIISQIMDSINDVQTSTPEMRPYLNLMNLYLSVMVHSTKRQLDYTRDPVNAFMDFPEMRKMWLLMDDLPELYLTYYYTSVTAPNKITNFTTTLTTGFESICDANPADLMTVPPDLDFDFANFLQKLCAVNLTTLLDESMRFNSQDNITRAYENFNNLTDLVNLNDMSKKINDLTETFTKIFNFTEMTGNDVPRFLNFTLWTDVMNTVNTWVMDPEIYSQMIANSNDVFSMLSSLGMTETDRAMLRNMEAINMLMETLLDKLEAKNGTNETLKMEDFFKSSTEVLKLIHLIQKPGMMDIFVYSSNNPEFSATLTKENIAEAIDELCAKDWVEMLKLPVKKDVDYKALQDEYCAINFTAIVPELYEEFRIQDVIDKMSSNDSVDWQYITKQNERLQKRIERLINSPMEFELPAHWTDEEMWIELFTTYSEMISNVSQIPESSTIFDQVFTPMSNPDIDRIGAAVNVLMDVLIKRLEDYPEEITLDYLLNNNTDLRALVDAINALSYTGTQDFLDGHIDVSKLLGLVVDPTKLEEACNDKTFLTQISKTGNISETAHNIEEVLCMDTEAVSQALMDISDTTTVQDKLMKIFNESEPVSLDWKSLGSKVDSLTKLMTEKFSMNPTMSVELTELFNINKTIPLLESLFTNPNIIGQMSGAVVPILDPSIIEIMHPMVSAMADMLKILQDKDITVQSLMTNPEQLNDLLMTLNTFSNLLNSYNSYTEDVIKPAIEHAGTIDTVKVAVCDVASLYEKSKTVPIMGVDVRELGSLLCGKDGSEWFNILVDAEFPQTELLGVKSLLESFYKDGDKASDSGTAFTKSMTDLVELYMHFLSASGSSNWVAPTQAPFDVNSFMNETLRSFISYMEVIEADPGTWVETLRELRRFFSIMSNIQNYLNEQLEKGKESGKGLQLETLLPDAALMADMLTGMQSEEYTSIITLMSIYPEKFLNISVHGMWEDVACNPVRFYTEFYFDQGFDSEGIRNIICEEVSLDNSTFSMVLDSVQMGDLLKEISSWIASDNGTAVNKDVWNELLHTSEQFLKNVLELQDINLDGMIAYGETLLKHLAEVSTPSTNSYTEQCESTVKQFQGTEFYDKTMLPILNMVYTQTSMQYQYQVLTGEMLDVMCEEPASNMTRLIDLLKKSSVPEIMKEIAKQTTESLTFSCEGMVNVSLLLAESVNKSLGLWMDFDRYSGCVEDQMKMMLDVFGDVTKLFEASKVLLREINDEDFREFITSIAGNEDILQVMEYIMQGFVQQQNWVEEANKKIGSNITELENYIQDTFSMSPDVLQSILNATFSKDMSEFTAEELVNSLCADSLSKPADNFLSYFNSSLREAIGIDCEKDWNTTYDIVSSLLTLSKLAEELQTNIELDDISWWMGLSQDLTDLASGIQGLSELTGILNNLNDIDIATVMENGELLGTIQRLLIDSGPESLVDNLNNILDKLGELNDESQDIFKDMQILTRGMLSFTTLRRLIISNVQIKDLLKEPEDFQKFLIDNIDIPKDVAEAIIDGSLSFELLVNASHANVTDWVCEPEKLSDLLNITSSKINHEFVSETFCNLDTDTIADILSEVINQLDIGDLVEEFLTASIDDILKESGITRKDTEDALDAIQNANDDLKEVIDVFDEYTVNMKDAIASLAEAQIGTSSPSSLSSLLCGETQSDIDDDFKLSDSLPSAESLSDEQKEEMEELKAEDPVCGKLYMDIMTASGGPIIWGYLKPIMRGKILFSPNNEVTRGIIEKMNSTFGVIAEFQEEAVRLASGATSLNNITSGDTDLAKLISSPIVESFLSQFSDSSESSFEDLVYTLNNTDSDLVGALSNAASFMGDYIHCIELDRFVGFDNEADLEWEAAKLSGKNNLLAGIVFTNADQHNARKKRDAHQNIPSHLMYKIRMDIDNVEHTQRIKDRIWRPQARDDFADELRYFRGFVQLQDMVDSAIIESLTGADGTKVVSSTKQFPFPCHKRDTFLNALIAYLLPVMMTFAWLAGLALATYNLVLDREDGQEETLRAMGLVCCFNWWAWFISTMLVMSFVSVIVTIISHYTEIVPFTNFGIIFLYFLDFCFSATMLCYFVSAFFTRTSIAILVTLIVYFISYIPYMVLLTLDIQMTFWQKTLACLSSTSAFGFSAQYLAWYEEQQIGINWSNIGNSAISGDEASFSWCCIMMVIDGVIYLILGWYVRSVKPGKYGVSEPWYFPICPWYWSSCCGLSSGASDKYRAAEQGEQFEAETTRSPKVISVRGLSKEYKVGKPVVSDLNMDVHAGQVTALLGHNGAAKTTTMNMLTGILEPTTGDVSIFNQPLKNMKSSIGICPQHNALYKYMTVIEHMEFVQSVKSGSSHAGSKDEIRQILEEVNLWHCRQCSVNELSGGMQRRLCVAIAFVGNSKAVILDEPTSGVDPSGRRSIWNLIIRKKGDTSEKAVGVLLSTHHLDEAEVISDRVCILHEGKLLCSGSPLYLKEKFTKGHRMIVETERGDDEHSAIALCIQHYVPSAVLQSSIGNEMTFVLPTSNRMNFYNLFRTLEEKREELQVAGFGISDPTLEEVFLTVCRTTGRGEEEPDTNLATTPQTVPLPEARYNTGLSWKFQQFFALFVKRFHHYRRNWRLFLSAILLPVLLFLAASGLHTVRPDFTQENLILTPAMYGPKSYFFTNDHTSGQEAMNVYNTFMEDPGVGTTCMENMEEYRDEYDLECVDPHTSYNVPDYIKNPNANCSCKDYKYTCSKGSARLPPRERVTTTSDILQNLDSRNTEAYLFESFDEFKDKRFGGYSFEDGDSNGGTETRIKSTVWFNNKGYHSLPSFYSGLSNAVLRSRAQGNAEKYGITTFNHPFTFNTQQLSKDTILQSAADLGIAATIMLAFTFIPVGIVMYSVNEYINKEKHLQFTSGIGPALYWFTSYFWDLIVLAITTALVFAVMAIFRHDSFWARNNAAGAVVLILLYGWATLPLVYCTTKLFNAASTAFLTMFCILNFIGLVPICIVFVLNFYQHIEIIGEAFVVCQKVFLIFPTYTLGAGLIDLMTNQIKTNIFARFGTDVYVDPFTFDLLGWNYVALGIEGFVFFVFAVLCDVFTSCRCDCDNVVVESDRYDDTDVQHETSRLCHRGNNEDSLVARNISKVYRRAGSSFLAVDHVTFGASRGDCFGLLGVNGAGKTTTFKIFTGSLNASEGSVYFSPKGFQVDTSKWQNIGYCPQEEALDSFLTVREMLEFFGKMRGLDGESRKTAIRNVIENLKLQPIVSKTVRTCSGGMKRKLSLAIALLGDPSFVLLDEPTTGMDPVAKRLAWNCIKMAKSKGQTIVLTSHSMEECDVLCSRISILVNGQMKCLGSPQHLKNKFGDTYTIMLHVSGPLARSGKIFELVQAHFPGASIRDHHLDVIQLDIPKQTTSVSEIFRVLENEKDNYNIVYYTVSQNTLETIFLNFAREQHDTETEGTGSSDRSSDLTMPTDEESKLSGKLLPHTRYGYMNKGYEGFGEFPVSATKKMVDPDFVTIETGSAYSTNL